MVTFSNLGKYGRLGNQLFQIAVCIGYAKKNNMDYVFPTWKYSNVFNGKLNQTDSLPKYPVYTEPNFHYNDIPFFDNVDLVGYYQSFKYFDNCKKEIRELFEFKSDIKDRLFSLNKNLLIKEPVSIHIRRGDYLSLPNNPTLKMEYYNQCIKQFDNKQLFIVFSDDIAWCKNNFIGNRFSFSEGSEIDDLCLMTLCKGGHIMANSSFSYWGSILADSRVVFSPKNWFGSEVNFNSKDLYKPEWVQI